jgi:hypothetical protein
MIRSRILKVSPWIDAAESTMEVWETVAELSLMLLIPGGVVLLLLPALAD